MACPVSVLAGAVQDFPADSDCAAAAEAVPEDAGASAGGGEAAHSALTLAFAEEEFLISPQSPHEPFADLSPAAATYSCSRDLNRDLSPAAGCGGPALERGCGPDQQPNGRLALHYSLSEEEDGVRGAHCAIKEMAGGVGSAGAASSL